MLCKNTDVVPKLGPAWFAGHQTNLHNGASCPVKYTVGHHESNSHSLRIRSRTLWRPCNGCGDLWFPVARYRTAFNVLAITYLSSEIAFVARWLRVCPRCILELGHLNRYQSVPSFQYLFLAGCCWRCVCSVRGCNVVGQLGRFFLLLCSGCLRCPFYLFAAPEGNPMMPNSTLNPDLPRQAAPVLLAPR